MAPHQARTPLAGRGSGILKARKDGVSMKRSGNAQTRPQVVASALAAQEGNGWITPGIASGIMQSASRMLTKGAHFLFNSMFKHQTASITAPPAAVVPAEEAEEEVPPLEMVHPLSEREGVTEIQDTEAYFDATDRNVEKDSLQVAELETILKEKDLTREECERFIELIQSRLVDDEAQLNISPWRRVAGQNSVTPSDKALVLKTEVPADATRLREVTFSSPLIKEAESESEYITRPGRWTPIQRPITGGKELLKRRSTVLSEPSDTPSPRPSLNRWGPSVIRSPALKRKDIDLTCFRKTTTNSKTPLRLDVPSVPRQSARAARAILDTMEQKSPFQDPRRGSESKQAPSEVSLPSRATLPATSSGFSGFSFPSSAQGPEPPTPKPMPSPYTPNKPRGSLHEPNNVKNGLLPSFQLQAIDLPSYPVDIAADMDKIAFERVERALGGSIPDATPSQTNSLSFPDGVGDGIASFETGSSSRGDDGHKSANPFGGFSGSITGTSLTAATTKTTTMIQSKEGLQFDVPERNSIGAQSLAPPDTVPANHCNGNSLPGVEKHSKRRKSVKRLK